MIGGAVAPPGRNADLRLEHMDLRLAPLLAHVARQELGQSLGFVLGGLAADHLGRVVPSYVPDAGNRADVVVILGHGRPPGDDLTWH